MLDVGMDFEFVPSAVRDLYCGLDLRPDAWMFHWRPAAGRVELWRNGTTVAEHVLPADLLASRRSASAPVRVEYGFLDARFFFAVDSRADMLWCIDRKPEWMTTDPGSTPWAQPRTRLYVGANASGPVAVPRLAVFRDVHWFRLPALGLDPSRKNASKLVPPGHLYLLGDNSFDSKDSRMFGAVPVRNFAGRPRMVLGPWPRLGWLSR